MNMSTETFTVWKSIISPWAYDNNTTVLKIDTKFYQNVFYC